MNIVLIGMRGSGKTTVGKLLAEKLGKKFIEMDELIAQRVGHGIPEIVAQYGWGKFREAEAEITREVAELDNVVNATGGGVVTREENVRELKRKGKLVWLKADIDTLLRRIGDNQSRPSLTGKPPQEDPAVVLAERTPIYQRCADVTIDTEDKSPEEVAEAIARVYSERGWAMISAETKVCCLIGDPVEHSLSPLIHNRGYEVLGLNFVYVAFTVKDIKLAIEGIRGLGIRGVSITMPHKISAMQYIDDIDETAREIGAINTIVNNGGVLSGFNTDHTAALKALEEKTSLKGKRAVLLGAGGSALAIALGLKRKDAHLVILNRTADKARALAQTVNAEDGGGLDQLSVIASADILINATAVGMWPRTSETIVPRELLHPRLTVFDINYHPKETRLITEAKQTGCTVIYGYKMFLYQAAIQFELFTGHQAPLAEMETALTRALEGDEYATSADRR